MNQYVVRLLIRVYRFVMTHNYSPMSISDHNSSWFITSLMVCWFACVVFLRLDTSARPVENLQWFVLYGGLTVWTGILMAFAKKLRSSLLLCLSWNTLRGFYCIGVVQAVYGLLHYYSSGSFSFDGIGATGSFDNPAGYASLLALLFPIGLRWWQKSKGIQKIVTGFAILICVVAIVLSYSRAGFIAILVSAVILVVDFETIASVCRHKMVLAFLLIVGIGMCIALYLLKPESVLGRLYVWKIAVGMVCDRPFMGYGVDGFERFFMTAQAKFLENHPSSDYALLADNIKHPFNEFILTMVNHGLLGLFFAIACVVTFARLSIVSKRWYSKLLLSMLSSFCTLSMFTYPMHYPFVWLLLIVVVSLLLVDFCPNDISNIFRWCMVLLCLFVAYHICCRLYDVWRWQSVSEYSHKGYTARLLDDYGCLSRGHLKKNGRFLFNYAAELNFTGDYDGSLKVLHDCKNWMLDYDVAMLYVDNLCALRRYDSAMNYVRLAHNMVPCRFVPCYYALRIFREKNDGLNAKRVALDILNKHVKVPSAKVHWIQCEARNFLVDYCADQGAVNAGKY